MAEQKTSEDRYLDIIERLLLGEEPEPASKMDWAKFHVNSVFRGIGVLVGLAFIITPMVTAKAEQYGQFLLGSGIGVITGSLAASGGNDQGKAKNKITNK